MSKSANNMKQNKQSENSSASLRLKKDSAHQVQEEVYVIAKRLARIAVDEYLNSIIVDSDYPA